MPQIPNRTLKHNPFQYLHTQRRKHDWLPLTYPGVPKYLWEIPPKKLVGTYVPYKERQRMGFDDLMTEEDLQKRRKAWEKDKHNKYSVQWIDENGVDHIGPPQGPNAAVAQVVGAPPRPPPATPNQPILVPADSGPVFPQDNQQKSLWSSLWGRFKPGVSDADIRVQNTRPVRNSRREGVADMVVSADEQSANGLGVVNGTQLSDGSIGTAPHAPLETFLSSGNSGARTAHDLTHMQVLNPQPAYFPAALETKPQQGDKAHFPFKFEQTILPPSSYGTEHVPVHYKTNDPQISDRSFSTTHLGVDAFGHPYPEGEQTQFSQNVVRKHTHATKNTPFQDAKQLTSYAQGTLNEGREGTSYADLGIPTDKNGFPTASWVLAQQNNNGADSTHIPTTEEFLQKLETRGAYSGRSHSTVIPEEPMTEATPTQAPKVFQQLRKKKMSRFQLDSTDAKYKQTLQEVFKSKPTPAMQNLQKEIDEQKQNIEKRKNEATSQPNTKKVHRLEQEEMILEQERNDNIRLEELQKLQLAAELELIQHLEEQQREREEIALAAVEYDYQNTPMGRGAKAKAGKQLTRGLYEKEAREELKAQQEAQAREANRTAVVPYINIGRMTKAEKRRYIKDSKAERKRKRYEAEQEAQGLAIYNAQKEQHHKSTKLAPGALPGRTFTQNLTHLDAYIRHMQDEINARHGVMVPYEAPRSQELTPIERKKKHVRLRASKLKVPITGKKNAGMVHRKGGRTVQRKEGNNNIQYAAQILKYERQQPHPDQRKIHKLKKYIKKQVGLGERK